MRRFGFLAALGAAAMYFFDPQNGKRRRHEARDRTFAFFRSIARRSERAGRYAASEVSGAVHKAQHLSEFEKPPPDDVTLAHKVETELFRDADVPKGEININAENGKVVLRGQVQTPELIRDLEERARKVQGVQEVENLLHLPGTPAPMHQ
jgi:osmotically-inducible protein OsmY